MMIKDVLINKLNVFDIPGGNVMHAMKMTSKGYEGFGEAYFSQIEKDAVKAWKRHKEMTLNLIVPVGEIRFIFFDDRVAENTQLQEIIISKENYCRLTIPPMIWMGFQGLSDGISVLLNIANIEHNADEVDKKNIKEIKFNWND